MSCSEIVKPERDALAEEWREVYADVATKTANLFGRITINNEALAELHRDRPAGVEQHLLSAELHARGRDSTAAAGNGIGVRRNRDAGL